MLSRESVQAKIIEVLTRIQEEGNFTPVKLTKEMCPVKVMPEFDSQLWIVAITILSDELDLDIPENRNIFLSSDGNAGVRDYGDRR
jgi:hypothetical protein